MIDHLANRQTAGLAGADHAELNLKLDAIARYFDLDWLTRDGDNPLQVLWKSRDGLATNELLNFGDAVQNFTGVDEKWLKEKVSAIKTRDAGNRAGAIFELLALNFYLSGGSTVLPSTDSNPGYDGVVVLPDDSRLLVSIKNHGMTSHEKYFLQNAKELDEFFVGWLHRHARSGIEVRIICHGRLDTSEWGKLKLDVKDILNGQLDGTARNHRVRGNWNIVLKNISEEHNPLSTNHTSSIIFIGARAHKNEQDKFIEDLRKGCSNLVKHTKGQPENACSVLFVRLCANASLKKCKEWAHDYFKQYPSEKVGVILLYQAAVVTSGDSTLYTHHLLPIEGPQYAVWTHPASENSRSLPNLSVVVGSILEVWARRAIQSDGRLFDLDDTYVYQRGEVFKTYRAEQKNMEVILSNPAPQIKIHAEFIEGTTSTVVKMITPRTGELLLLP